MMQVMMMRMMMVHDDTSVMARYSSEMGFGIRTVLWLGVEENLGVLDAVLWKGNDVTVAATLATSPQRS